MSKKDKIVKVDKRYLMSLKRDLMQFSETKPSPLNQGLMNMEMRPRAIMSSTLITMRSKRKMLKIRLMM